MGSTLGRFIHLQDQVRPIATPESGAKILIKRHKTEAAECMVLPLLLRVIKSGLELMQPLRNVPAEGKRGKVSVMVQRIYFSIRAPHYLLQVQEYIMPDLI